MCARGVAAAAAMIRKGKHVVYRAAPEKSESWN